jgi:hypothetical protein
VTFRQAQNLVNSIEPVAKRYGFIVALHGSVLRNGRGNDLDLIIVAWRPRATAQMCALKIADTLGFNLLDGRGRATRKPTDAFYTEIPGALSVVMEERKARKLRIDGLFITKPSVTM